MTDEPETTAVAVRQAEPAIRQEFNEEQVGLIRRMCCAGSSNDELALFLMQCRRTGLDPLSKQIHAVKRGGKMTIQVGIDGLRLVAERTGETDGQDGPYWCGEDGVWKDVWIGTAKPVACKVTVFRKGQAHGYTGVARWAEFYSPAGGMWDKMPSVMIAKVAESIALRKGFPQELSGIYADEEMDQADARAQRRAEPQREVPFDGEFMCGQAIDAFNDAETADRLTQVWGHVHADEKKFTPEQWALIVEAHQKAQDRLAPKRPAENLTLTEILTRMHKSTPADAADLCVRLKWLAGALGRRLPDFAEQELFDVVEQAVIMPSSNRMADLTRDQCGPAWVAVKGYVEQAAKQKVGAAP